MASEKSRNIIDWEYADAFYDWLTEVDHADFDYIAVVTRRAANIIFLLLEGEDNLKELRDRIITDNALLLEAENIVDRYVKEREFPKIAILDDVLAHGRALNYFMGTFRRLLFRCLNQKDFQYDLAEAETDYYNSITLWMFAINDAPVFLDSKYQWRLRYQNIWAESQWRLLSNSIAKVISEEDTANTAYILSAKIKAAGTDEAISEARLKDSGWLVDKETTYRGNNQHFYLFEETYENGVYPTVRSYVKENYRYFTPYFFVEKLETSKVVKGLNIVFDYMFKESPKGSNRLVRQINRIGEFPERLNDYCQLFYLILSQITLNIFWSDSGLDSMPEVIYDYDKIARNFSPFEDMETMLQGLINIRWPKEILKKVVESFELKPKETGIVLQQADNDIQDKRERIVSALELKTYEQALLSEKSANNLKENRADTLGNNVAVSDNPGETSAEIFLREALPGFGQAGSNSIITTIIALSVLTQMMDQGDVALKARTERMADRKYNFYSAVRNTELSLSIMPRRLGAYYMEFFHIAQFYWRDKDFPERVRKFFKYSVFRNDPRPENERYTNDAVLFAQYIQKNSAIVDSMLNWRCVCDNPKS